MQGRVHPEARRGRDRGRLPKGGCGLGGWKRRSIFRAGLGDHPGNRPGLERIPRHLWGDGWDQPDRTGNSGDRGGHGARHDGNLTCAGRKGRHLVHDRTELGNDRLEGHFQVFLPLLKCDNDGFHGLGQQRSYRSARLRGENLRVENIGYPG
jgi:hypothetical protein